MLFSTTYLGSVAWYQRFVQAPEAVLCDDENYRKQTCRNRCTIAMPEGPAHLIVPVSCTSHTPIKEVRISDHGNWRHHHWQALKTAYGKSPFFEYYADDFAPFYTQKWDFLWDYNEALRLLVCSLLDIDKPLSTLSNHLNPSNFSNPSNSSLPFDGSVPFFPLCPYYQVFQQRNGFLSNLSIVDLLFNMGPEGLLHLWRDVDKDVDVRALNQCSFNDNDGRWTNLS